MKYEITELSGTQLEEIEDKLSQYDRAHIGYEMEGRVSVGIVSDGKLIAGADGLMTAFKIFYISTVFVDEAHRGRGVGRALMREMENRARILGANLIRLDTFNWQGEGFYQSLGYERVGYYESPADNFSESFFLKRLEA